jgi:uncharacterized OB-fold protein
MTAAADAVLRLLGPELFLTRPVPSIGEPVQLLASRCEDCCRVEFPVRDTCPVCREPMTPRRVGAAGTVRGFTSVTAAPPGALIAPPYVVAMVAFAEEGISVMGLVAAELDDLAVGDPVTTELVEVAPGVATYGFGLA